ncbi:MAG: AAA family ATPase [Pseudomonadota bacterium]
MTRDPSPIERMLAGLCAAAAYDHATTEIHMLETHISWIFLTGEYAYKIKKPVTFDFVDFSTLALRAHYCHEELRLNRRLAPDLYLAVVAIGGAWDTPRIGQTPALEYAVKMRQFKPNALASQALANHQLTSAHMRDLATRLAEFHRLAARAAAAASHGSAPVVIQQAMDNFIPLRTNLIPDSPELLYLNHVESWLCRQITSLTPIWEQRKQQHHVREGHGDLHLANIIISNDRLVPFDALEFNEGLRFIDTVADIAFLIMDLDYHSAPKLSRTLLNEYLDSTGDFAGVITLRFYLVYRALVRAKVATLRSVQLANNLASSAEELRASVHHHLQLAFEYTQKKSPIVLIMHGLSGSGKSTLARALAAAVDAIWVRSDTTRKRLAGLTPDAHSDSPTHGGLYQASMTAATYDHMLSLTENLVTWDYAVLVDATFLTQRQRTAFRQLARTRGLPFSILHCHATPETLKARIETRQQQQSDASEATLSVLHTQLAHIEPLSAEENPFTITIDSERPLDIDALASEIRARTGNYTPPRVI